MTLTIPFSLRAVATELGVTHPVAPATLSHNELRRAAHLAGWQLNGAPFPMAGMQSDFMNMSMGAGPLTELVYQAFISTQDFIGIGDWPGTKLYYKNNDPNYFLDVSIVRWPDIEDVPDEAEVDALFSSTNGSPQNSIIKIEWTPYMVGAPLQVVWGGNIPNEPLFGQDRSTFWTQQNLATHTLNIYYT